MQERERELGKRMVSLRKSPRCNEKKVRVYGRQSSYTRCVERGHLQERGGSVAEGHSGHKKTLFIKRVLHDSCPGSQPEQGNNNAIHENACTLAPRQRRTLLECFLFWNMLPLFIVFFGQPVKKKKEEKERICSVWMIGER
jgi:hypothetical protein